MIFRGLFSHEWINAELAVVEQKHKMDVKLCKSARSRAIHSAADLATLAKLESVLAAAKTAALEGVDISGIFSPRLRAAFAVPPGHLTLTDFFSGPSRRNCWRPKEKLLRWRRITWTSKVTDHAPRPQCRPRWCQRLKLKWRCPSL